MKITKRPVIKIYCKTLSTIYTLYGTLTFIIEFCIKERLFDEVQISGVHFRIEVVVEVVENNQRTNVVDKDEGDDNHHKDEEDPKCSDG